MQSQGLKILGYCCGQSDRISWGIPLGLPSAIETNVVQLKIKCHSLLKHTFKKLSEVASVQGDEGLVTVLVPMSRLVSVCVS